MADRSNIVTYASALAAAALPLDAAHAVMAIPGLPADGTVFTVFDGTVFGGIVVTGGGGYSSNQVGPMTYMAAAGGGGSIFAVGGGGIVGLEEVASGALISSGIPIVGLGFGGFGVNAATTVTGTTAAQFLTDTPDSQLWAFTTIDGRNGWLRIVYTIDLAIAGDGPQAVEGAIGEVGERVRAGSFSEVPLPASLPLAALGVLALGAAARRRKHRG